MIKVSMQDMQPQFVMHLVKLLFNRNKKLSKRFQKILHLFKKHEINLNLCMNKNQGFLIIHTKLKEL